MKTVLHAVVAAFATFSKIPMPRIEWNEKSLRGLMGALPLVGVAVGLVCYLYFLLAGWLRLPAVLSAVVLTSLPLAVSGGIHMDGFADTIDALSSYGDPEKKRAILKDPHAGAFAILGVGCYLLLYFGLCTALPLNSQILVLLGITHVLARANGALAGTVLKGSTEKGMLAAFRDASSRGNVWALIIWGVLSLAGAALLMPLAAALFAVLTAGVFYYVKRTAEKQFGGMSGDLAGFCISVTEIALLLGLVLSERLTALL